MAIQDRQCDAGPLGDVLLRRAGVAVAGELLRGGIEQQCSDLGRASAGGRRVRPLLGQR
jgi:hypothetical protein